MEIKRQTFIELQQYCTPDLLRLIDEFNIDDTNTCDNLWNIPNILLNGTQEAIQQMKVAFVFEKLGGDLYYQGEITQFSILTRELSPEYGNICKTNEEEVYSKNEG